MWLTFVQTWFLFASIGDLLNCLVLFQNSLLVCQCSLFSFGWCVHIISHFSHISNSKSQQLRTRLHCGTITIAMLADDYHCEWLLRQPTVNKSRNNALQRRDAHLDRKYDFKCVEASQRLVLHSVRVITKYQHTYLFHCITNSTNLKSVVSDFGIIFNLRILIFS